ncbi:MAG: cytochrome c oxidase assembly protein [Rhodobacter sp.]|nr:cytochrome c oxidase assembly protein [Rhodobacter sp.]
MEPQNRTLTLLVGVVAVMTSLSFAAVPFYDWFCRVTGFGGTTSVADAGSDLILDRSIKIRFDASLEAGMPWDFRPAQTEMELRIGETALAFYEAYNPTDHAIAGTASYNVSPYAAGGYFTKIDCFCFEMQVLQPGERVMMPVSFYVDPAIVDDPEGRFVKAITLSYTFHQTDLPEAQAAVQPEDPAVEAVSN